MQFLHPLFLVAAATILIPVIIHLFYFRRYKKVFFTNVSFLKELKEETAVRSRLRNLLVLLLRCLAILALVLAFAQPFIKQNNGASSDEPKHVMIYLDNSLSMTALKDEVPLLELAKSNARSVVQAYRKDDVFSVISNQLAFRSRNIYDQKEALAIIEDIDIQPNTLMLEDLLSFQAELLSEQQIRREAVSYIFSDFQEEMCMGELMVDSSFQTYLMPLRSTTQQNVGIDSVWLEQPVVVKNQSTQLFVATHNYGDNAIENTRFSYSLDGINKPLGQIDIAANSVRIDTVNLTFNQSGYQALAFQISDYPVQFDDTFFVSFPVRDMLKVLELHEQNANTLAKGFKWSSQLQVDAKTINQLDYGQLGTYDLIIMHEIDDWSTGLQASLNTYLESGGNIWVIPTAESLSSSANSFLRQKNLGLSNWSTLEQEVGSVNTSSFIFKDVFENPNDNLYLPATQGQYNISGSATKESILTYRNGMAFLVGVNNANGSLFLTSAPLDASYNNLLENPAILVPMIYKMASSSMQAESLAYFIGTDDQVILDINSENSSNSDGVYTYEAGQVAFIPAQQLIQGKLNLNTFGQVETAQILDLKAPNAEIVAKTAFNYDRKESNLAYITMERLMEELGGSIEIINEQSGEDLTSLVEEKEQGLRLWTLFLLLALLFLLSESLVLRFWKIN